MCAYERDIASPPFIIGFRHAQFGEKKKTKFILKDCSEDGLWSSRLGLQQTLQTTKASATNSALGAGASCSARCGLNRRAWP